MKKFISVESLIALFCVILFNNCGSGGGTAISTSLPNDNFNYSSSFPTMPWSVFDGSDGTHWTIVNESGNNAANYAPVAPGNSALVNDNYSSGIDSSVTAVMKVSTSGAIMELLLRASVTGSNPNYYALVINTSTNKISINKVFTGGFSGLVNNTPADLPLGFNRTIYHTYKFSLTGSGTSNLTLRGFIDSTLFITDIDDSAVFHSILTTGKTGFYFIATDNGSITSFQVTEP